MNALEFVRASASFPEFHRLTYEADVSSGSDYESQSSNSSPAMSSMSSASSSSSEKEEEFIIESLEQDHIDQWSYKNWRMIQVEKGKVIDQMVQDTQPVLSSMAFVSIERILNLTMRENQKLVAMGETIKNLEDLLMHLPIDKLEKLHWNSFLQTELKTRMDEYGCDAWSGLKIMKSQYDKLQDPLKQVRRDLWSSTMTVAFPGKHWRLLSQSRMIISNWKEILNKFSFRDLGYEFRDAAKLAKLTERFSEEDITQSKVAEYILQVLDINLSRCGYTASDKHRIYNYFHQGIFSVVTPKNVANNLWLRAKTAKPFASEEGKQKDLDERHKAYSLAWWRSGIAAAPPIEPGSELDVEGLADYTNSQIEQPDTFSKKVIVFNLDLSSDLIIGHYLVHFKNPDNQKEETHYYRVTREYLKNKTRLEIMEAPEDFPDLEQYHHFKRFVPSPAI